MGELIRDLKRELREEILSTQQEIRREHLERNIGGRNYLFDHMDQELADRMERIRLGGDGEETEGSPGK